MHTDIREASGKLGKMKPVRRESAMVYNLEDLRKEYSGLQHFIAGMLRVCRRLPGQQQGTKQSPSAQIVKKGVAQEETYS